MKNATAMQLAQLCDANTFEAAIEFVDKFNITFGTSISPTEVVLEMNKNGYKIPVNFEFDHLETFSKVLPCGVKGKKMTVLVTTKSEITVDLSKDIDLQILAEVTAKGTSETIKSMVKPTKKKRKKSITRKIWTAEDDELVMSDEKISLLAELLGRSQQAVYNRRYNLRKQAANA